jgi:3-methylfumaryl-CoA hydratase
MSSQTETSSNLDYSNYVGRTRRDLDVIDLNRARGLHGTLGDRGPEPVEGDDLSPLGHWLHFWEVKPPSELGPDGHPHRGEFLPPIPLPRRMWAGSRVQFLNPLPIGALAWRNSTIANVQIKSGGSGQLAIVTVRYEVGTGDTIAIVDEQDIIYRQPSPIRTGTKPVKNERPADALIDHTLKADPVLLFRYSALTFNGHRIHYDRNYAMQEEQYPGLVVHGPLLATLMVRAACEARPDASIRSFSFRASSPIFDIDEFHVGAHRSADSMGAIETWVIDPLGKMAFSGTATFG